MCVGGCRVRERAAAGDAAYERGYEYDGRYMYESGGDKRWDYTTRNPTREETFGESAHVDLTSLSMYPATPHTNTLPQRPADTHPQEAQPKSILCGSVVVGGLNCTGREEEEPSQAPVTHLYSCTA